MTSESSPGACPVEDPSKFHLGKLSTFSALLAGNVRVFERVLPSASTQTYSARIVSSGNGNESYLAITAGSSDDFPVSFCKTTLFKAVVDGLGAIGAKATADDAAERMKRADAQSFMVACWTVVVVVLPVV